MGIKTLNPPPKGATFFPSNTPNNGFGFQVGASSSAEMFNFGPSPVVKSTVFSEDMLKIEICGPDADYLTVIDVPGIFRNPTEGVTTKEDMAMVKNIVTKYIKDNRTIILAVLPCNIDIANQEILTLAEEYDKAGERTLGILTKPDLLLEPSTKNTVCSIVEGKKKQLKLGFYLVRSRGADQGDIEFEGRESMFREEPWRRLPPARVGVCALKARLGELLGEMTRREFPNLRRDISDMLRRAERQRDALGPSRNDEQEQRIYLSEVAQKFQDLVRAGLEARYAHDGAFDDSPELRLITQVVNLADSFNSEFGRKALVRNFEHTDPHSYDDEYDHSGSAKYQDEDENEDEDEDSENSDDEVAAEELRTLPREVDPEEFPELEGIISQEYDIREPEEDIMGWLTKLYIRSRGIELTASDAVWNSAWREQSSKWALVSNAFVSRVIVVIHRFITRAISLVCADQGVREGLWSELLETTLERYRRSIEVLQYLVSVECNNKPYTLDRHFSKAQQAARANRVADRLMELYIEEGADPRHAKVTIQQVRNATETKSNLKDMAEKLHDDLQSYYDVAKKRFVDNVFNQAVGHHLLMGPSTPLKVFSQKWVIGLSAEQLDAIAGEQESVKQLRVMLDRQIKDFKEAKKILQY